MNSEQDKTMELLTATTPLDMEIQHMEPLDRVNGFDVRPGFYMFDGATPIPRGVCFTVQSQGAVSCELLLYRRKESEPYAVIPFPDNYKIGNVYSMVVFGLNVEEFEYAYRLDGPYNPKEGLLFDKRNILLDPYAKAVTGQSTWGRIPGPGGEEQFLLGHGSMAQDSNGGIGHLRDACPGIHHDGSWSQRAWNL
mgnify:CR=1 FL=1